jgi:hypothetical protein
MNESDEVFAGKVKEIAREASGKNKTFEVFLDGLALDEFLPIRLKEEIEIALSDFLAIQSGSQELTDLIKIAKTRDLFSQEDIDLLYTIRNQRNVAAHPRWARRTLPARTILSPYAAAIVWPKLAK